LLGVALAAQVWAGEVASVEVRNLSDRALENVPVTFGQAIRRGDVPKGQMLYCAAGKDWAQIEVKRVHEDGSPRFAIVSAILPNLPAKGSATLKLGTGRADAGASKTGRPPAGAGGREGEEQSEEGRRSVQDMASPRGSVGTRSGEAGAGGREELLKTDFDAVVTLTFPDGAVRSARARAMLKEAGVKAKTWLQGHVATEWLVSGPPVDKDGKPDEDLNVQFQVRAYAGGTRVRVSVVVENCWDAWAGSIRYDAAVTMGGKEVFAAKAADHRPLSRWRKVFWWGGEEPPIQVVHDLTYLSSTGALPNYDTSLPAGPARGDEERGLAMKGPNWEIMGHGSLTAYMPTTGGRPEIGPYPAWAVRYLLHKDPRARDLVLANGDLAGSWPIHVRARKTGRVMTIDERPDFWLDGRGKDKPAWKPDRTPLDPKQPRLSPDLAHQGSFAYVPYLLTGDFYYLEEAYLWASYCLLVTWPAPRQGAKGIIADQIRGDAWALRNIADAAWIAPTGDPEAKYFDEKIRNNIADRTRRMLGPPEFNSMGFWAPRTVADARIQNPANPNWLITAPWEHDYLIWSFHHLVELGWSDAAKPRDFLLRWRVGTLTHAPDYNPMLATPYRMVVGEKAPGGGSQFYDDWKKLGEENAKLSKPDLPNYGNSYAYSARAAVVSGLDGGFPKAREALDWLEANLPNHRQIMAKDPTWAILPRGVAAR
jgi:hypothetical protein